MLDFGEISLKDKPLFDSYFSSKRYENSEFTFTNLFIWRHAYHFSYAVTADHLCIMGMYRNRYPFLFPPLHRETPSYDQLIPILKDTFHDKGYPIIIKSVTEDVKEMLQASFAGGIVFKDDRDNHDYIYAAKDLIELTGKRYRQKRNHINKFLSSYSYTYEEITEENLQECLDTAVAWAEPRIDDKGIQEERTAITEALTHFEELKIRGAALRINGTIQSFTLGERLNEDTAVIHIEKANTDYHGSYAMINQQFAEKAWGDTRYINREEDMGIPGLRKAKESYHPVKMVVKYTGFVL